MAAGTPRTLSVAVLVSRRGVGCRRPGAHALASAYLDGLALAQDPHTLPQVMSIGWGAWGETGRAVDPALQDQLASSGMGLLASAEGLWHLDQAVMRAAPIGWPCAC